jgi:hypothetical protein
MGRARRTIGESRIWTFHRLAWFTGVYLIVYVIWILGGGRGLQDNFLALYNRLVAAVCRLENRLVPNKLISDDG